MMSLSYTVSTTGNALATDYNRLCLTFVDLEYLASVFESWIVFSGLIVCCDKGIGVARHTVRIVTCADEQ